MKVIDQKRHLKGDNMSLDEYQKKRDFDKSPEPKGGIEIISRDEIKEEKIENAEGEKGETKGHIFVIHEHHATRLHWDLRLEIGGVLKSWAVPKSPIYVNSGTKRLAIQVEDHPIEYATFEGMIPAGMYGAGTVEIYDSGELILEENKVNKLTFQLKGKKLNGRYVLINAPNMGEKSWLFIKKK